MSMTVFFEGHYKTIWKEITPPILTEREILFIKKYFQLNENSLILDLMCGYGRHAVGLAEIGFKVTAIDNLKFYTDELERIAKSRSLPIHIVNSNILTYATDSQFDLVLCMGNSLNFFNSGDLRRIFENISTNLYNGGFLLFNSWSIAEIAFREYKENSEATLNNFHIKTVSSFKLRPTRIEAEMVISDENGRPHLIFWK